MPTLAEMLGGQQQRQPTGTLADSLTQPSFNEEQFQKEIRGTEWFADFMKEYGEEPDLRPMSENPELGPNYDYRKAWSSGVRPVRDPYDNNRFHWSSSLDSGEMLKSESHPTAWKEHFMRQFGVNPDSLSPEMVDKMRAGQ